VLFQRPNDFALWEKVADAQKGPLSQTEEIPGVDFDTVFRDFDATVDWPGCNVWKLLAKKYPDAKVLLNVRNPETWIQVSDLTRQRCT
jgi:hypothetical protein